MLSKPRGMVQGRHFFASLPHTQGKGRQFDRKPLEYRCFTDIFAAICTSFTKSITQSQQFPATSRLKHHGKYYLCKINRLNL